MKLNLTKAKDVVKKKTPDQKVDTTTGEVKKVNRGRTAKPTHGRFNIFVNKENYQKLKDFSDTQGDTLSKHLDKAIEEYLKKKTVA